MPQDGCENIPEMLWERSRRVCSRGGLAVRKISETCFPWPAMKNTHGFCYHFLRPRKHMPWISFGNGSLWPGQIPQGRRPADEQLGNPACVATPSNPSIHCAGGMRVVCNTRWQPGEGPTSSLLSLGEGKQDHVHVHNPNCMFSLARPRARSKKRK